MSRRYIRLAWKETRHGKNRSQFMGAVIVRGGAVLAKAANINIRHAEERAISRVQGDCKHATLYIMRHNMRVSRPCDDCYKLIQKAGIDKIVYIGWSGEINEEKVPPL